MKKLKLSFDQLGEELEMLDIDYLRGLKGGYGGYGDYGGYGGPDNPIVLPEVPVYPPGSGGGDNGGGTGGGWWPPYDPGTGGGSGDPGSGGGGGSNDGGGYGGYGGYQTQPTGWQVAEAAVSGALAVDNFYTTLDSWRLGNTPTNIGEVVGEIFSRSPADDMIDNLFGANKWKGVAIISTSLNAAGHIMGVTSAVNSFNNLKSKLEDGQTPTATDWLDLGISVGQLFIKSNVVGVGVSFGWLVIKGQFEDAN